VIKELQAFKEGYSVNVDVEESTHYVSLVSRDETGNELLPGTTNSVSGLASKVFISRFFYFNPSKTFLNVSMYIQDTSAGSNPMWNFYINNVSDRYSIYNSFLGAGFEHGTYALKHQPVHGIYENTEITNDISNMVHHVEKMEASKISENVYPAFSGITSIDGILATGFTVYDTSANTDGNNTIFSGYLDNPLGDSPLEVLVYPSMIDYLTVIPPNTNMVPLVMRGNAVVSTSTGKVNYGSGNRVSSSYFLGNTLFMNHNNFVKVLPFHSKFSYSQEQAASVVQGDNVPVLVLARTRNNATLSMYRGNYGENRESDFAAVQVEAKWNGEELYTGNYLDFRYFALPDNGNVEIKITNANMSVNEFQGSNTSTINYNASTNNGLPTLQHLQFRHTNGNLSHIFNTANDGNIRIAAGDFKSIPNNYYYDYVEGNTVTASYSLHGQNIWNFLEINENPEYFSIPGTGNYYQGSLAQVIVPEDNSWFDVRLVSTDADGNTQEQIISPAFKIEQKTLGTTESALSSFMVYPNPFSEEISIKVPSVAVGDYLLQITDISGKTVFTKKIPAGEKFVWDGKSLPKGIYFFSVINNGKTMVKKVIKL